MASTYPASAGEPAKTQRSARPLRRAAFAALAIFILLGPAPGQLLGVHTMLLREWIMFSGAGVGLARGEFTLHRADGAVKMSPLEVVGLPTYLALPLDRRIYKPADLKTFAARICDGGREAARLSFDGSIAAFTGWRALTANDICNNSAQAHYSDTLP